MEQHCPRNAKYRNTVKRSILPADRECGVCRGTAFQLIQQNPTPVIKSVTAKCDLGLVRTNNEDMVAVDDHFIRDAEYAVSDLIPDVPHLFAVADGMGGHNAGEIASEFVLRRMVNGLKDLDFSDETALRNGLKTQIETIHADLNKLGTTNPEMTALGCTFTGMYLFNTKLFLVHIGDSRLYSLRGKYIAQISKDHTAGRLLNFRNADANKLVNCFGALAPDIFFDFEDISARMEPGDLFLLCSDGLSGELSEEEIETLLCDDPVPSTLINKAKEKGGRDNISCIIVTT